MFISVLNIHITVYLYMIFVFFIHAQTVPIQRHLNGLHRIRICEVDSLETVEFKKQQDCAIFGFGSLHRGGQKMEAAQHLKNHLHYVFR